MTANELCNIELRLAFPLPRWIQMSVTCVKVSVHIEDTHTWIFTQDESHFRVRKWDVVKAEREEGN